MEQLPSAMLQYFIDQVSEMIEMIFGAGAYTSSGMHGKLAAILILGAVAETMQLNGIYQNRHDMTKVTNSIALYGLIFMLMSRLFTRFGGDEVKYFPLLKVLKDFTAHEEKVDDHRAIMSRSMERQFLSVKAYIVMTMVLAHIPILTGFLMTVVKRELIMTFEIYLPYTDPKSLLGYSLGTGIQLIFTTLLSIIVLVFDVQMIFFSLMTEPMADILALKVSTFGHRLGDFHKDVGRVSRAGPSRVTVDQIEQAKNAEWDWERQRDTLEGELIDLIGQYEKYDDCIGRLRDYISNSVFSVMYGSTFSIAMSLFYARTVSVAIGLPLSVLFCFQLFVPCLLGTIVAMQNQRLLQSFCDIPWYLLSLRKQKIFLQFMHELQCTNRFEMAIIGVVDIQLFADTMNATYSFLMFLLNFV